MEDGFLSFLVTCMAIELTPGPNMAYLAALSSLYGRRAGFSMVMGIAAGLCTLGFAAGLGAAALVMNNPMLYQSVRWAGVAYLLWLAWDSWRMSGDIAHGTGDMQARSFWRGFITNILNPKAMLFYVAVFPVFINSQSPVAEQGAVLVLAYVAIATTVHCAIVLLGDRAGAFLRDPAVRQASRYAFSGVLLVIAAWFALMTAA
jgi:threonine/homoserine/homoserine lactone efflux protein